MSRAPDDAAVVGVQRPDRAGLLAAEDDVLAAGCVGGEDGRGRRSRHRDRPCPWRSSWPRELKPGWQPTLNTSLAVPWWLQSFLPVVQVEAHQRVGRGILCASNELASPVPT